MSLSSLLMTSVLLAAPDQTERLDNPLALIETYHVNQRMMGLDHPRMRALRDKVRNEVDGDFRFDLRQVQKRLEELTAERESLLRQRGLKHPDVVENAARLTLMSRILAGQSAAVLSDIYSAETQHQAQSTKIRK